MIENFVAETFVKDMLKDSLLYHLDLLQVYRSLLWDYRFSESRLSFSLDESIRMYVLEEIPVFRAKAAAYLPCFHIEVLDERRKEFEKDYWDFFYASVRCWGRA